MRKQAITRFKNVDMICNYQDNHGQSGALLANVQCKGQTHQAELSMKGSTATLGDQIMCLIKLVCCVEFKCAQ